MALNLAFSYIGPNKLQSRLSTIGKLHLKSDEGNFSALTEKDAQMAQINARIKA